MGRKITKPTPIRPIPEPETVSTPASLVPATAAVVSASSSSTAASSDTIPVVNQQSDGESDVDSTPKPDNKQVAAAAADAPDSESESESESDSDGPAPQPSPPPKPQTVPPSKRPDSESESESDSDGTAQPSPPKPKTLAPSKRPAEGDTNSVSSSVKRAKKDNSEPANQVLDPIPVSAITPSKKLFERLWSHEDELVILKGLNDYKDKKGIDPMDNADDFVIFIKKNLHVAGANKTQIIGKVRRLKKRFDNLQKRKKVNDPHEIKVLELARKVWGYDDVLVVVPEVKKKPVLKSGDGETAKRMANVKVVADEKGGFENVDMEVELGFGNESGRVLREAMKWVEGEEKNEMQTMVDKANVAFLDAYLLKLKVLEAAARKIFDGINNDQC